MTALGRQSPYLHPDRDWPAWAVALRNGSGAVVGNHIITEHLKFESDLKEHWAPFSWAWTAGHCNRDRQQSSSCIKQALPVVCGKQGIISLSLISLGDVSQSPGTFVLPNPNWTLKCQVFSPSRPSYNIAICWGIFLLLFLRGLSLKTPSQQEHLMEAFSSARTDSIYHTKLPQITDESENHIITQVGRDP